MQGTNSKFPISGYVGLAASTLAIVLWVAEHLLEKTELYVLAVFLKLILLGAPLLFLRHLSAFLHERRLIALGLGLSLVAASVGAMLAYLPWREAFAERFSNSVYRWYFDGMPQKFSGYYGDFAAWQDRWARAVPHTIEIGLLLVYYGSLITLCTLRQLGRLSAAWVAILGYLMLFLVPMLTGLIAWDYDTFLMGIAFDSISMDLFPLFFWQAGDHSIFLYAFLFIFFVITAVFFFAFPRSASCASAGHNHGAQRAPL